MSVRDQVFSCAAGCVTFCIDYREGLCHGIACLTNGIGLRCGPLTLLLVNC